MLQSIRDHTHGWIAGVIISLLILSFALWGIHSYIGGAGSNNTVAEVNGVEITKGQLSVAYERLRRQLQSQFTTMPEGAEATLKDRALQTLIDIQVLKQASVNEGYRISDRQVDGLLQSMPEFQVNNQFSLAKFQQLLSNTMFSAPDFLELIQTSLLIDQPRLGIIFSSFALPNEVQQNVALVNQEREIQYVVLPTLDFLNQPISIAGDKVEAYYASHQSDFRTVEQVSIDYIELSVKNLMAALHPSDQDLKNFYNENSGSFAQPAQWKLEAIYIPLPENASNSQVTDAQNKLNDIQQKISKGENFADFAKQYPADKLIPHLNDWLSLNQIPQPLQKTVMELTKSGQVSTSVHLDNGFVLLKAADLKEAKVQSFEQVKDKVKDAYTHQIAEEKFAELRDKLANMTYEHPESLQSAAQSLGLQIKSTGLFSKEKGGNDLSSQAKVREAAFSNDVLNAQNNSDVIQLANDSAIVLRIKSHVPATLLPLKSVDKQITDKLKAEEATAQTARLANEIKDKLTKGMSLDKATEQYRLNWTKAGFITRHTTKVDTAILNEAFAMPKPTGSSDTYSIVKVSNGYAVIALMNVKEGVLADSKEQSDLFAEQVQNSEGLLEYELYKNSLMLQSKIVIANAQSKVISVS